MRKPVRTYNLCFLGFGNVNRALVQLLLDREEELRERYEISWRITGVASRRLGWIAEPQGLTATVMAALVSDSFGGISRAGAPAAPQRQLTDVRSWLAASRADVLFEATSLNVENGQPGIDHIRAGLEHGADAITANKGPIVHSYRELRDLAAARGRKFLFESTVMDGVPVFSLFEQMPAIHLHGFHGILNSTTNVILSEMERGLSFDAALQKAQAMGIAETDAAHDIDGWDAVVKTAALITVLMDVPIKLQEIERIGIRGLDSSMLSEARMEGRPYRLVCRAKRDGNGVKASVRPERVSAPMSLIDGTSSYVCFNTDIFPRLEITEGDPGLYATAYGMMADFIRAVRK
ncbi:MAG: homoserine dehydrogenase [Candidatus Sulfotelmatobacter sp.]